MKRFLQIIYSIYAMLFFVLITVMLFLSVLFSLPFGKIKTGNIIYKVCNFFAGVLFFMIGIKYKEIYEAPHDFKKEYIFIANHSSYMDIPAVVRCMHQPVRILGKQELMKYPLFGLVYRAAVICVDRSSVSNRAKSLRALKAAIHKCISVFIFPEGTFNETDAPLKKFYDGAFRIAIETKTPVKPVLFLDNPERLHWSSIFSLTPGKSRVVFLEEINVEDFTSLEDVSALKEKAYNIMDDCLRRYKKYKPALQTQ